MDTCGFAAWEALDSVREYTDLFLYDLKLMDDSRYRRVTGVPNKLVLKNLEMLSSRGHDIILRAPIVPGINDDDEDIRQTGVFVAELPHLNRVDILPYHHIGSEKYGRLNKVYGLPETCPPLSERVAEIVHILREFGLQVRIGG